MNSPLTDAYAKLCLTDGRASGYLNDVLLPYKVVAEIEDRLRRQLAAREHGKQAEIDQLRKVIGELERRYSHTY